MELKDFVSNALKDIFDGIVDAQSTINSGSISPLKASSVGTYAPVTDIDFDVAVTVEAKDVKGIKGKAGVLSIAMTAGSESTSNTSSISRIKFSIPVQYPTKIK